MACWENKKTLGVFGRLRKIQISFSRVVEHVAKEQEKKLITMKKLLEMRIKKNGTVGITQP